MRHAGAMDNTDSAYVSQGLAAVNRRIEAVEWNVARLLTQAGLNWEEPPPPEGPDAEIVALVRAGNKIQAIKRYRELTGVDLATAEAAVDQMG